MIKLLLIAFALISACVAIHGAGMILGLRWIRLTAPKHGHHFTLPAMFWIIVRVVYGLFLLHILQILVWAGCYEWVGCFPDFSTSFYYSAMSYSTVGYGDVVPQENWRILGSIEAVTGVLMFGWSTGVLFSVVNHFQGRFAETRPNKSP
jgi:hypothetical protein